MLQTTGPISLADINLELGRSINAPISLNDPDVRRLLEKPEGLISLSHAYGKSNSSGVLSTARIMFVQGFIDGVKQSIPSPLLCPDGLTTIDIWGALKAGMITLFYSGATLYYKGIELNGVLYMFDQNSQDGDYCTQQCSRGPAISYGVWYDAKFY